MAAGADIIFAEAAALRRLPWLAHLPFAPERFRQDFTAEEWPAVQRLLTTAVSIQIEPANESSDEAYLECGTRIVDECDVLIAVWNGAPAGGPGGTGDLIAYAHNLGRPLIWIHSRTLAVTASNLDQLPGLIAPVTGEKSGRPAVIDEFARLDQAATQHAPEVKQLTISVILLHLVASAIVMLALVTGLTGLPMHLVTGFEIACLSCALWVVLRHRQAHHSWMNARISAEICRSALATWELPASGQIFPKVDVRGFERLQSTLRLTRLCETLGVESLATVRDRYLAGRIQNQIDYFSRQSARAEPRLRGLRGVAVGCTVAAIVLGSTALALNLCDLHGQIYVVAKALSLLLPLLNAALLAYVVAHDLSRRVSRYHEMTHLLRHLERRLAHTRSWGGLERLVTMTEEALIQEVMEWHSVSRFSAESH